MKRPRTPNWCCSGTRTRCCAARVRYQPADGLWLAALSGDPAVCLAGGIRILASPPQAPKANAICERVIGTLRREVPGQLLIVSERHLRQALTEYLAHYNTARPHRVLGQLPPAHAHSRPKINLAGHRIRRK